MLPSETSRDLTVVAEREEYWRSVQDQGLRDQFGRKGRDNIQGNEIIAAVSNALNAAPRSPDTGSSFARKYITIDGWET